MMTALLLYAYCHGPSTPSRRIAKACERAGRLHEHRRARRTGFPHRSRLPQASPGGAGELFAQVSAAVPAGGAGQLGHVALDGTKIKANASKHKAMSYERMERGGRVDAEGAGTSSAERGRR